MSPQFCTDLAWIESHIRHALPGSRCEVVGPEGATVQAQGDRPGLTGVRLIGDGFERGTIVYVRYTTGDAECGFFSTVRAVRSGGMLLEQPVEVVRVGARMAA